jgi:DNA-binding response OmpR family regulator
MAMARILIVEDEPIVALNYASILQDAGYEIVGPVGTINEGISVIESEHVDGAVLDINLGGVSVDPIVTALTGRRVPYLFVSGFRALSHPYRNGATFVEKPCTATELLQAVAALTPRPSADADNANALT